MESMQVAHAHDIQMKWKCNLLQKRPQLWFSLRAVRLHPNKPVEFKSLLTYTYTFQHINVGGILQAALSSLNQL